MNVTTTTANALNKVFGRVKLAREEQDAFGRLKVSEPTTLFESQFQFNKLPFLWNEATQGAGSSATHVAAESAIDFVCDAANGDYVIRQSRLYIRYQPGKSQHILLTGILGDPKANVVKRAGVYDDTTGLFFEVNETGPAVVVRTASLDGKVQQPNWNIDRMDGTGPSGFTLDTTRAQIFVIDFQWLGVGTVRFGLDINGQNHWVHQINHANIVTTTYMTTPNLPVRYEIRNVGAASVTSDMKQICCSVTSEGGVNQPVSFPWSSHSSLTTAVTASSSAYTPVVSLRLKDLFNTVVNRGLIRPVSASLIVTSSDTVMWGLILNGTLSGASWASRDPESIAEVDLAATSITGGRLIDSGFASATNKAGTEVNPDVDLNRLMMARNIANTDSDVLTLVAHSIGTVADVHGSLTWRELY